MKYLLIALAIVAFSCHHKHKFIKAKWQGDTLTMYVDKDVDMCFDSTVWFRSYTDSSVNIKRIDIIGKKDGKDTLGIYWWHLLQLKGGWIFNDSISGDSIIISPPFDVIGDSRAHSSHKLRWYNQPIGGLDSLTKN